METQKLKKSWLLLTLILSMHGSTMKLSNAQQAKICNNHQNTRLKLLKTNAAIWFNRMCKIKQLKPNYIHFKTNGKTPQDIKTVSQTIQCRITQEIKFLHKKKQNLNSQLYHLHLKCAGYCNGMWQHIRVSIQTKIKRKWTSYITNSTKTLTS